MGFRAKDFSLFANMFVVSIWNRSNENVQTFSFRNDANEVGGSVYQRFNNRLETGVQLAWTSGTNQTRFALASKYQLDSLTAIGAKVNNVGQIGLSFQQMLQPGKMKRWDS